MRLGASSTRRSVRRSTSKMGYIVRDEGGLICPMFDDFVEGVRDEIHGWEVNGAYELMNQLAPYKCWLS